MSQKMRVGIKAAYIGGACLIIATIITVAVTNSNKETQKSSIQNTVNQKTDSGANNNYSAGRDVKIENNTYNVAPQNVDSIKVRDPIYKVPIGRSNSKQRINNEQTNVKSINQSGGQTAKEIINNNY